MLYLSILQICTDVVDRTFSFKYPFNNEKNISVVFFSVLPRVDAIKYQKA